MAPIKSKSKKRRETRHLVKTKNALDSLKAPNMSRRVRGATLAAFPTFDKCDSLVFFPVSLVKCLNSDDFVTLKRLLSVHLHKNCVVHFKGANINVRKYLHTVEALSGLHPDKMSCVHDTTVVDDTIIATVYTKFTDNVTIYDSIFRSKGAEFPFAFPHLSRVERWRNILLTKEEPISKREEARICALASGDQDFVVYGAITYTLKFDFESRKVVRLDYQFNFTSAEVETRV